MDIKINPQVIVGSLAGASISAFLGLEIPRVIANLQNGNTLDIVVDLIKKPIPFDLFHMISQITPCLLTGKTQSWFNGINSCNDVRDRVVFATGMAFIGLLAGAYHAISNPNPRFQRK